MPYYASEINAKKVISVSLCVNNLCQTEKQLYFPASVGEIGISAVGTECFPKNPYKITLYYTCLNPHGSV